MSDFLPAAMPAPFPGMESVDSQMQLLAQRWEEMSIALEQNEVPIGCVVVCQGTVIARAHNLTLTLTDPTAHAEMQAITMACDYLGGRYLTDCTLYVTVEPCPMCAAALAWAQLGRLVWGADDPKRGYTLFSPNLLHPKTQTLKGVLAEECGGLVSDFFKSKR